MSPVSNTPDGNTKPKTEPRSTAAAADAASGIIHLTIPIVIPPSAITMQKGIQNNENPSIVAQPLVVTAGIDAKIVGSPSAIKAEHNDDDDDKAPGVGTTDTKTSTHPGSSISISCDAIKDDTMSAIEQALNEGKDTGEIQKITKQRKHMWKSMLTRAGMNKAAFKTIWAEVKQYCEEKHHENERVKKCNAGSSSACKSEDDSSNSVEGAEVAMKSEPTEIVEVAEEECNIHMPLKKRKLPSDYVCALSVKFDEVAMSPTLIKKLNDEEISTTVKIKEEEEEVVGTEGKRDNGSSMSPNRAEGPSLQDVLKALSGDETAKTEEEGVGEETVPSKQKTTQKRKRKPFEFGEWDSIEYFARV